MVLYGQLVVGPPGSGKTTYCHGMKQFTAALGRKCEIINLDFANDVLPYEVAVDVRELVSLEVVMDELKLGPNGGLVYCMEYLLDNADWLEERIAELDCSYIIFDCPGQVELFTHYDCVRALIEQLTKRLDARLCSVHLIDSFYCTEPATFISASLLVLTTMMKLQLPHVGVLSKVDLLRNYGQLPFTLDFFTDVTDLTPLVRYIGAPYESLPKVPTGEAEEYSASESEDSEQEEDPINDVTPGDRLQRKFKKMSSCLCEFMNDCGLVSFTAMNIEDAETVGRVLAAVDKANGFSFAASEVQGIMKEREEATTSTEKQAEDMRKRANHLFKLASNSEVGPSYHHTMEIMERYESATAGGEAEGDTKESVVSDSSAGASKI